MIRICPTCGYRTDHLKHFQNCSIPKSDWPAEYSGYGVGKLPFPQVSVKIADANGIHEIPVAVSGGAVAAGVSPSLAEGESSSPSEAAFDTLVELDRHLGSIPPDATATLEALQQLGAGDAAAGIHRLEAMGDVLDAVIANEHLEMPRLSEADRIRLAPGACCAHPQELHIADAEGFPPTCMGCPDGLDEHEWKSRDVVIITTVAGITSTADYSRTINSPLNLVCPDCSFLARTAAGLKTHRTRKHADG